MEQQPAGRPGKWKNIGGLAVVVLLMALTFWLLLRGYEPRKLLRLLAHADWRYLLPGFGLVLVCIACEGSCLRTVCLSLGHPIRRSRAFVYANTDYYFSAVTPSATGGQPAMAYYMAKDGVPLSKSGVAILITIVQYTAALLLLGVLAVLGYPALITDGPPVFLGLLLLGVALNAGLIAASLLAMFQRRLVGRIGRFGIRLLARIRLLKNSEQRIAAFEASLDEYAAGARYVRGHPLILLKLMVLCILQRVALLAITWLVYRALGLHAHSFGEILALQTLTTISVCALPLPGAVGAAEGMFLLLFSPVFGEELLMPAMLLTRGITYYFCLAFSGGVTLFHHIRMLRHSRRAAVLADVSERGD